MTHIRDHGHATHAIYSEAGQPLGDDAGPGLCDSFTLDVRRQRGICEGRKPEHEYGDAPDRGICSECWADHDAIVEEDDPR